VYNKDTRRRELPAETGFLVGTITDIGSKAETDMNLSSSNCPDKMEEEKLHISSRESSGVICLQVLPSYLLAGLGMVTAGTLLDQVQVSDALAGVESGGSVTPEQMICGSKCSRK
uniref:Uncharacterized protein n=1 Tax=Seriola dumerili TaxID=41447 RepID=A0A3B4U8L3_SERDU